VVFGPISVKRQTFFGSLATFCTENAFSRNIRPAATFSGQLPSTFAGTGTISRKDMTAMNQRFDPSENRNVNPAAWPAEQAGPRIDPVTGTPVNDPLANQRRPEELEPRSARSKWPVLIILLAGLVLALLVWLPAELSTDPANDAATQPPATEQTTTPPADTATPPVDNSTATPPVDNSATPGTATPDTNATPDTTTTPNATPATPDTQTPATGTDTQTPATGTAPQN
jgi:hypothetical protein